jgi:hypothetical protein
MKFLFGSNQFRTHDIKPITGFVILSIILCDGHNLENTTN